VRGLLPTSTGERARLMATPRDNREWRERHKRAVKALTSAAQAMDFLSQVGNEGACMKTRHALHVLQGSAALLREADAFQRGGTH
jgi:hypothetical protein